MVKFKQILNFLNLLDDSGRLSITNLAVMVALAKLGVSHTNPVDVGVLFTSILNYGHKRLVNAQGVPDDQIGSADQGPSNPA